MVKVSNVRSICVSLCCALMAIVASVVARPAAGQLPHEASLAGGVDAFIESPAAESESTLAGAFYDAFLEATGGDLTQADPSEIMLTGFTGSSYVDGYNTKCGKYYQILPDGLIYRSYLAGPREPRISTTLFHGSTTLENSQSLWDGTVGGRRGLIRYGTGDPLKPEGWQIDVEGAAIVRLNLGEDRDLDASDFRFGFPVTWGNRRVQYKSGYYHLSSHLGDELIVRTGSNTRVNYVRDAILFGVSYNPFSSLRVYGETAYAFFTAGGAEPWEFQLGFEYHRPGPTGIYGTPFFAMNAHLREEVNFGGDWTTQTGWLWRGVSGSTFRLGFHYVNGKSTQYQFFANNEEQVGVGAWYDF